MLQSIKYLNDVPKFHWLVWKSRLVSQHNQQITQYISLHIHCPNQTVQILTYTCTHLVAQIWNSSHHVSACISQIFEPSGLDNRLGTSYTRIVWKWDGPVHCSLWNVFVSCKNHHDNIELACPEGRRIKKMMMMMSELLHAAAGKRETHSPKMTKHTVADVFTFAAHSLSESYCCVGKWGPPQSTPLPDLYWYTPCLHSQVLCSQYHRSSLPQHQENCCQVLETLSHSRDW